MDHRFRPTSADRKKAAAAGVLSKMDATLMELDSELLSSGTSGFQSPISNGDRNSWISQNSGSRDSVIERKLSRDSTSIPSLTTLVDQKRDSMTHSPSVKRSFRSPMDGARLHRSSTQMEAHQYLSSPTSTISQDDLSINSARYSKVLSTLGVTEDQLQRSRSIEQHQQSVEPETTPQKYSKALATLGVTQTDIHNDNVNIEHDTFVYESVTQSSKALKVLGVEGNAAPVSKSSSIKKNLMGWGHAVLSIVKGDDNAATQKDVNPEPEVVKVKTEVPSVELPVINGGTSLSENPATYRMSILSSNSNKTSPGNFKTGNEEMLSDDESTYLSNSNRNSLMAFTSTALRALDDTLIIDKDLPLPPSTPSPKHISRTESLKSPNLKRHSSIESIKRQASRNSHTSNLRNSMISNSVSSKSDQSDDDELELASRASMIGPSSKALKLLGVEDEPVIDTLKTSTKARKLLGVIDDVVPAPLPKSPTRMERKSSLPSMNRVSAILFSGIAPQDTSITVAQTNDMRKFAAGYMGRNSVNMLPSTSTFFILTQGCLFEFKSHQENQKSISQFMIDHTCSVSIINPEKFVIQLGRHGNIWFLACPGKNDMDIWIRALNVAIEMERFAQLPLPTSPVVIPEKDTQTTLVEDGVPFHGTISSLREIVTNLFESESQKGSEDFLSIDSDDEEFDRKKFVAPISSALAILDHLKARTALVQ